MIQDDRSLARLVTRLERQSAIALDTEANPLFAYQERLCLIQISTSKRDYLLDPLSGLNLGLLAPVLADPGLQKIMHGAEYDILLLKRSHPFEISGLFDTMVAATSLGIPSPGLASLLKRTAGVQIDKKYQRSDWGKRPLTDGQLEYARCDTRYLLDLAQDLRGQLYVAGSPHMEEVAAECRRLESLVPDQKSFDPEEFAKIKGAQKLRGKACRALRELNIMRHRFAKDRDRPLFKILGNEMLLSLAKQRPRSLGELKKSRILSAKLVERYGEEIIASIREAASLPPIEPLLATEGRPEDSLTEDQRMLYDAIRRWRKDAALRRKTDASLVLNRIVMLDLSKLRSRPKSLKHLGDSGLFEPWRLEAYGEELLQVFASWRESRRDRPRDS
ncbi:MAG: ribonuclease D [Planctomycetota bacterium]|jgi:ribonuclease D